jgi:hypothetical protein
VTLTDLAPSAAVLADAGKPKRKSRGKRFHKVCPECACAFIGPRDQRFCTDAHKTAFHNLMKKRGGVAVPLMLAWRLGKSKASEESRYALAQLSALADLWNAEDKAAGRMSAATYIKHKMREGWRAVDLVS